MRFVPRHALDGADRRTHHPPVGEPGRDLADRVNARVRVQSGITTLLRLGAAGGKLRSSRFIALPSLTFVLTIPT